MHLLQIPDPCLLAVLQCLADDATSLCSAARAHSRLHQAAMPVLTSIKARIWQQEKLNSLLLCLDRYSQHISHLDLGFYQDVDDDLRLQELPPALQLHSLQIYAAELQLQPGDGFDGVLGPAAAALTQLRLSDCWVLGGQTALAATLPQLTKLVHLAFSFKLFNERQYFPAYVLQDMQHLTYLEFACCLTGANGEEDPLALQPLQVLTRLVDLRLAIEDGRVSHHDFVITASMLSGACNLTRLDVSSTCFDFEAGALAGKPRLQHLQLASCRTATAEQVAQRLSQLQHLQQLTYLCLDDSIEAFVDDPPAAAFSALTASCSTLTLGTALCRQLSGSMSSLLAGSCRCCGHSTFRGSGSHQTTAQQQGRTAAFSPAAAPACSAWT